MLFTFKHSAVRFSATKKKGRNKTCGLSFLPAPGFIPAGPYPGFPGTAHLAFPAGAE
jgi:hypothetical protein